MHITNTHTWLTFENDYSQRRNHCNLFLYTFLIISWYININFMLIPPLPPVATAVNDVIMISSEIIIQMCFSFLNQMVHHFRLLLLIYNWIVLFVYLSVTFRNNYYCHYLLIQFSRKSWKKRTFQKLWIIRAAFLGSAWCLFCLRFG